MKKKLKKAIKQTTKNIRKAENASEALQYSQTLLNLLKAKNTLKEDVHYL